MNTFIVIAIVLASAAFCASSGPETVGELPTCNGIPREVQAQIDNLQGELADNLGRVVIDPAAGQVGLVTGLLTTLPLFILSILAFVFKVTSTSLGLGIGIAVTALNNVRKMLLGEL